MLELSNLLQAVDSSAALRYRNVFQPTAGPGTKVYPALYSKDGDGSLYAFEDRVVDGKVVRCALVDSTPSQANRMEDALSHLREQGRIRFPVISVDLSNFGHGLVSTLNLPHRVADAYLTFAQLDCQPWSKHSRYREIANSAPRHATALYLADPISLLFGVWFSHDKNASGRFARLLISELVAINAAQGVKSASRLDPLGADTATKISGSILEEFGTEGTGKPAKDKKLSELGFGNVLPTVNEMGGVTCDHVLQTATISMSGLRRLSFPTSNGKLDPARDSAARAVLSALGIVAIEATASLGVWLRSGCDLVAIQTEREVIGGDRFELDLHGALKLFDDAVSNAKDHGLCWEDDIVLDGNSQVLKKRFAELKGVEK